MERTKQEVKEYIPEDFDKQEHGKELDREFKPIPDEYKYEDGVRDYIEDMKVDETALDVEWLNQPTLARKYGKHLVTLTKQLRQLKKRRDLYKAELILKANQHPEETCAKAKPNAADIDAYVMRDSNYRAMLHQIIEKEAEVEYAEIAKNEISFTRKSTLENLVLLHGQMYFAGPKIPRNLSEECKKRFRQTLMTSAQKNANSKIRIGK
jgi:hypothetical protein